MSNRLGMASFKQAIHPQLGLNYGNGSLCHTDQHTQILLETGCTFADIQVPLMTYRSFVERESISQVDLFVLDVEGHELDVIEGMQDCPVLPDVMCVEVGHTRCRRFAAPWLNWAMPTTFLRMSTPFSCINRNSRCLHFDEPAATDCG